jgi:drug/metabolite transporter (DMT)-like permease
VWLGLAAGLAGMAVLLLPDIMASLNTSTGGTKTHHAMGIVVVLLASLSWSIGSLHARQIRIPSAPSLAPAMQTLVGGSLLLVLSALTGEWQRFSIGQVGTAGLVSVEVVAPARVSTYAFVNPVVAVLLGCVVLDEPLNARMLVAAAIVIAGVALITIAPRPAKA